MRTSKFSAEQIVNALRQVEGGTSAAQVMRELGVTRQTYYNWRRKYGPFALATLRRVHKLEGENRKLKQLQRYLKAVLAR